ATSEKGSPTLQLHDPVVTTAGNLTLGDADGDGRVDILTGDPAGVLRSNGDGTFASHQSFGTTSAPAACPEADGAAAAADQNGDAQADLLCSTAGADPKSKRPIFSLWAQPSPVAPPAPHRWTPFDKNGDGLHDLYTVHYRNPGYEVYTLLAQPGGGYA